MVLDCIVDTNLDEMSLFKILSKFAFRRTNLVLLTLLI